MLHLFTDSLTTLPPGMIEQLNIGIAPVYVVFNNAQIYRHTVDIQTEDILSLVMETGKVPGIAAPAVEDFIQLFTPSVGGIDQVVYISMSAEISPSYRNAEAAAKHFPKGKVTVVDSGCFSSGTAMMMVQAARIAKKVRTWASFGQKLDEHRAAVREELILDRMKKVNPTGNIYGLPNRIISPLKLKPKLHIQNGISSNLEDTLLGNLRDNPQIDREFIVISQTMAREPAEYMKNILYESYGFKKVILLSNINGLLCRTTPRSIELSYLLKSK
ncbi:DegV family protein [Paenibacillus sp. P46E]|uniref:DegV family protein n=1 Tax=Paenibacillus sp. P46E TaxID=1349436 RepID=UPI00093B8D44|nr:DegV family protein [Paenibacillus sp. P46E]OKP97157.1 hypothetical protein A3849_17075 [Paenibacillus sp. P46E]